MGKIQEIEKAVQVTSKIVQLTELEFHKLMRYTDAVASLEAQAELLFAQVRAKIDAARKLKDDFTALIAVAHPEFSKTTQYTPVESECALHPVPQATLGQ